MIGTPFPCRVHTSCNRTAAQQCGAVRLDRWLPGNTPGHIFIFIVAARRRHSKRLRIRVISTGTRVVPVVDWLVEFPQTTVSRCGRTPRELPRSMRLARLETTERYRLRRQATEQAQRLSGCDQKARTQNPEEAE